MRKRVLLDEHLGPTVAGIFGPRDFVHVAKDVGLEGKPDNVVIDYAISKKLLIITNDRLLVQNYRQHPSRRAKRGLSFFYGLIYVRADSEHTRKRHIQAAIKEMAWDETRQHDDLVIIGRNGRTQHVRLCHPECAAEFEKFEERMLD